MADTGSSRRRLRVGVVFGGRSGEHDVSLRSARSIIDALDPARYEVVPLGITRQGRWLRAPDALARLGSGEVHGGEIQAVLAEPGSGRLITYRLGSALETSGPADAEAPIDVVFPALHGPYGEDGSIQGLLEMANVPYVGAGVLGSALGMDKAVMKQLLHSHGLPVPDWVSFTSRRWAMRAEQIIVEIEAGFGYPCFVKPANLGSSVGISKAHDESELRSAIEMAGQYDRKIVVERAMEGCREIECAVLGNDDPIASVPGEIVPDREWYDYDAKYSNSQTEAHIPAQLPSETADEVRRLAIAAFRAIDCAGMARVDFFVGADGRGVWINELNTIPGFTSISMYPKLWEASGLPISALVDRLIELAIERHAEKGRLRTER